MIIRGDKIGMITLCKFTIHYRFDGQSFKKYATHYGVSSFPSVDLFGWSFYLSFGTKEERQTRGYL